MIDVQPKPWWRRSVNVTPVAATFGGIAFCAALGCLLAFQCFDRVSRDLSLVLTFMGGAWGYIFWLTSNQARAERFQRMVALVAVGAIVVSLSVFPGLWWWLCRAGGLTCFCVLGGISATSMLVVGTGWGLVHSAGYLSSVHCPCTKASTSPSIDGVWDREMDRTFPGGKCDT